MKKFCLGEEFEREIEMDDSWLDMEEPEQEYDDDLFDFIDLDD